MDEVNNMLTGWRAEGGGCGMCLGYFWGGGKVIGENGGFEALRLRLKTSSQSLEII